MTTADAAATVKAFYAAIDDRPYEQTVAPFLSDSVVWHVAGVNPLAGTFRGVAAVLQAMRSFASASVGTLRLNTMTVLGDEHHAVAIHDATAEVEGLPYRAHEVDVFHVVGHQISEFWSFSEDQAATDRLWTIGTRHASDGSLPGSASLS